MIFKTFDSDIDKISAKWGIFGKSFNEIGTAITGRISDINKGFQATDDLLGAFKDTDSIWKRLYPSKESIESQMIDVDALYPEIDDSVAQKILNDLTQQQKLIDATKGSWNDYFKEFQEGDKWQIEFVQNTDLQKASIDDVKKSYEGARQSAIAHNAALKQQTLGVKAASVAMKALSVAGNLLLFWGITKVIEGVTKGIDKLILTTEEAQEALDNSVSKFEETTSSIESLNDELKTTGERITELQKLSDAGTISIAEQDELDRLKETNEQLERKIALEKDAQILAAREVLNNASNSINQKIDSGFWSGVMGAVTGNESVTYDEALKHSSTILGVDSQLMYDKKYYESLDNLSKWQKEHLEEVNEKIKYHQGIIEDTLPVINSTVSAYEQMMNAGMELEGQDLVLYERARESQQAYLAYSYSLNQTASAYKALTAEQQRAVLTDRLEERGIDSKDIKSIVNSISDEDLDKYYDVKFNFVEPNKHDYATAEEYGKAYAEAWLKGIEEVADESAVSTLFTTLSEDQSKAIESYKSTLSSISDVYENLSEYDLTTLMTTFSDYDWSNYISGVESLDTALQHIANDSLNSVIKTFDGFTGCEQILDNLREAFVNTFDYSDIIEKNVGAHEELLQLLDKTKSGYQYSKAEISDLINKYPDLSDAIKQVGDAYEIEESSIISLANTYVESTNKYIASQTEITKATLEASKARLENYKREQELLNRYGKESESVNALKSFTTGVAIGDDYRGSSYYASQQHDLLKYGTSDFDKVIEETEKEIKELDDYLASLNFLEPLENDGSGSSDSTSDFSESIDWAAHSVSVLEDKVSDLETTLDNTKGYDAQIKAIDAVIDAQEDLKEGYEESAKIYRDNYNSTLSSGIIAEQGISGSVRKAIESGEKFSIEDFIDKNVASGDEGTYEQLYNAINDAINWYNKSTDAENNAIKVQADIEESSFLKLELKIEEWQKQTELSQDKLDLYSNNLIAQIKYNGELITKEKERYKLLIQQAKKEKDYTKVKQLEIEQQKTLLQLTKEQFDRIQNYYDNRLGSLNAKVTKMNAAISLAEAEGGTAGGGYYNRLNSINQYSIQYLETERNKLRESLSSIKLYTDEWYEALAALNDVETKIIDLNADIAENNNLVRQLNWDRFDQLLTKFQALNDERDFLNSLLDSYEKIDENTGKLNSYGITSQAMNLANYDTYMYKAEKIAAEIDTLDSDYANDKNNSFYLKRREELVSQRQDAIQSALAEKNAVIDLVKEGINAEIEAYEELINAKKEALSAEKELHDYQKSITEKSKDVAMLQRQIAALEGDNSLENQKKLRELRSQLSDAKEDLEETQYDHSISEQQDALDKMLEDYKASMEDYMSNTDVLFAKSIAQVNAENKTVADTISEIAENVGYEISNDVIDPWKESTNVISNYGSEFEKVSVTVISRLNLIKNAWEELNKQVDTYSKSVTDSLYTEDATDHKIGSTAYGSVSSNDDTVILSSGKSESTLEQIKKICANAEVKANGNAGTAINQYILDNQSLFGGNGNKLSWEQMAELANVLGVNATVAQVSDTTNVGKELRKIILAKLKSIAGFNTGGIVQAMGKDDGLVKLKVGETVLTKKFTDMLPDTIKAMENFNVPWNVPQNLTKVNLPDFPEVIRKQQPVSVGDVTIHLDGSNVTDAKSFMNNLERNKEYIQHMVWDVPLGKGALNCNKYKRF